MHTDGRHAPAQGTDVPEIDEYGIRFPIRVEERTLTVVVPYEAFHKAEAALTGGPLDPDYLTAFRYHRSLLETAARRKVREGKIEPDGAVRITSDDLSRLET